MDKSEKVEEVEEVVGDTPMLAAVFILFLLMNLHFIMNRQYC